MKLRRRATVWCADCAAQADKRGGYQLGVLAEVDKDLVWYPLDSVSGRRKRRSDPQWHTGSGRDRMQGRNIRKPVGLTPSSEWLPAWCKRHGEGSVSANDVRTAQGNVVAKLSKATV